MFRYLSAEEKANTWTHLVALAATMVVSCFMIQSARISQLSHANYQLAGTVLFLIGAFFMYASSTLYHAVTNPLRKRRLRVVDHVSIYVMIAGSYSLICISVIGGWMGWALFAFLWACVLAGIIWKLVALGKHPNLSLALYLVMGWIGLLILVPMWRRMPHSAFWWIIAEGVFYTIGTYFFNKDEEHAFYHAVWHVFIMLGSAAHTVAMFLILAA